MSGGCDTQWCETGETFCMNGGSCVSDVTSSSCSCPPGVTGVNCETTDYCFNVDCNGRGRCESDVTTATHACHCVEGWQGSDCGMQVCLEGTCMNGGVCAFDGCRCESGWSGPTCEERLPLACLGVECAHGSCTSESDSGKNISPFKTIY